MDTDLNGANIGVTAVTQGIRNGFANGFLRIFRHDIMSGLAGDDNGLPGVPCDKRHRLIELLKDVALDGSFIEEVYQTRADETRTLEFRLDEEALRESPKE